MELLGLAYCVVQLALLGIAVFLNIKASANWRQSLERTCLWRTASTATVRQNAAPAPVSGNTVSEPATTIRRAA
jgi:hypothetical protein